MEVGTPSALLRNLNFVVPSANIEVEVQKRLKRVAKTAKMDGFRPGKVPFRMVVDQYGSQVRYDVLNDAVEAGFFDAVRTQNLRVAGAPKIEPAENTNPEQFEFKASFEVYPEIVIGDMAAITIHKPVAAITDADIDNTIATLQRQRVRFEAVDRASAKDDRITIDFIGTIDGVAFDGGSAEGYAMQVGAGQMLPEFEAAVLGVKAGDEKVFSLPFPADYHGKDVAGKTAEFKIKVIEVAAPVLPAVDSDFVKAFGIQDGSVESLRAEIRQNLELELKRRIEVKLKEQVFEGLRSATPIEVPQALVESEAARMGQEMLKDAQSRGMNVDASNLSFDKIKLTARNRVALSLIFAEIVKANKLEPSRGQVLDLITEVAASYEEPEAFVQWHFQQPERVAEFEGRALESNVVQWVIARATVVEAPTSFAELMGTATATA